MRGAPESLINSLQAPDGMGRGLVVGDRPAGLPTDLAQSLIDFTFGDSRRLDVRTLIPNLLTRTVSEEVLPRLLLSHVRRKRRGADHSLRPSARHVVELTRLSVAPDGVGAVRLVRGLLARGVSLDSICLDLLTPAARRLGALWLQDRCDFALVTIGTARLASIHEAITADFDPPPPTGPAARRILLAAVPGEQHVFAVAVLAGFFRRAGWSVTTGPFASERELVAAVRRESFDLIGLSVSRAALLDRLGLLLRRVRRASRQRSVRVMLGGAALDARPEAAALLGADASAGDPLEAVEVAGRLTALFERGREGAD